MHNFLINIQIQNKQNGKTKEKRDPVLNIEFPLCLVSGFFQIYMIVSNILKMKMSNAL